MIRRQVSLTALAISWAWAATATAASLIATAAPVRASCGNPDVHEALREADAAVVARYVRRTGTLRRFDPEFGSLSSPVARWAVDEWVKGRGPDVVTIIGFTKPGDEPVGLLLERKSRERYEIQRLCQPLRASTLRGAARPPAHRDGEGPAALFVYGQEGGERRGAWLDGSGRVLKWDREDGRGPIAVCPGGDRVVETAGEDLLVRDLATLELEARLASTVSFEVTDLDCRDPEATELRLLAETTVHVLTRDPASGAVERQRLELPEFAWSDLVGDVVIGSKNAGPVLIAEPASGSTGVILPRIARGDSITSIAPAPDGKQVAIVVRTSKREDELVLVDLAGFPGGDAATTDASLRITHLVPDAADLEVTAGGSTITLTGVLDEALIDLPPGTVEVVVRVPGAEEPLAHEPLDLGPGEAHEVMLHGALAEGGIEISTTESDGSATDLDGPSLHIVNAWPRSIDVILRGRLDGRRESLELEGLQPGADSGPLPFDLDRQTRLRFVLSANGDKLLDGSVGPIGSARTATLAILAPNERVRARHGCDADPNKSKCILTKLLAYASDGPRVGRIVARTSLPSSGKLWRTTHWVDEDSVATVLRSHASSSPRITGMSTVHKAEDLQLLCQGSGLDIRVGDAARDTLAGWPAGHPFDDWSGLTLARFDGSGVRSFDAIDGRFGNGSRVYILPGLEADPSSDPSALVCPGTPAETDQGNSDS